MTFPEQYAAVVYARSTGGNEWALDDDDEAHLQHIYDNPDSDRASVAIWADKLQEDGNEDLSHLLRHGAERGLVSRSTIDPKRIPGDGSRLVGSSQWAGGNYGGETIRQRHAAISFYFGPKGSRRVTVRVPTAHPEYRQMAREAIGTHPGSGDHWAGLSPEENPD